MSSLMTINKLAKEIKINRIENNSNNEYTYRLGYDLCQHRTFLYDVYPYIEILKNEVSICKGCWNDDCDSWNNGQPSRSLFTGIYVPDYLYYDFSSIKDMFIWLRQYIDIPEEVEKKFEEIFLLYKLNGFKEFN